MKRIENEHRYKIRHRWGMVFILGVALMWVLFAFGLISGLGEISLIRILANMGKLFIASLLGLGIGFRMLRGGSFYSNNIIKEGENEDGS